MVSVILLWSPWEDYGKTPRAPSCSLVRLRTESMRVFWYICNALAVSCLVLRSPTRILGDWGSRVQISALRPEKPMKIKAFCNRPPRTAMHENRTNQGQGVRIVTESPELSPELHHRVRPMFTSDVRMLSVGPRAHAAGHRRQGRVVLHGDEVPIWTD